MQLQQKFEIFEDFEKEFSRYCNETFQCFIVTDSKFHEDKTVKYKTLKFVHHHDPEKIKTKSKGIRPFQHY